VYAALLATSKDSEELDRLGIRPFGIVYVTLYPLEAAIANPKSKPEDILEKTDIGGPTLLRAAAKGQRLVLSDPKQIDELETWLKAGGQERERKALVTRFAAAAERRVANYVDASATYWEKHASTVQ
jgi:phosphoribosylaminoimidazolecarboxamide formyltransferase/IMP cyclohydrolase